MFDYGTERIRAEPDAAVNISMNQNQAYAVIQEAYENHKFQHLCVTMCRSTVFVGPTGTSTISNIMNIISGVHVRPGMQVVDKDWKHENVQR